MYESVVEHKGLGKYKVVRARDANELAYKVEELKNKWNYEYSQKLLKEQEATIKRQGEEKAKNLTNVYKDIQDLIEHYLDKSQKIDYTIYKIEGELPKYTKTANRLELKEKPAKIDNLEFKHYPKFIKFIYVITYLILFPVLLFVMMLVSVGLLHIFIESSNYIIDYPYILPIQLILLLYFSYNFSDTLTSKFIRKRFSNRINETIKQYEEKCHQIDEENKEIEKKNNELFEQWKIDKANFESEQKEKRNALNKPIDDYDNGIIDGIEPYFCKILNKLPSITLDGDTFSLVKSDKCKKSTFNICNELKNNKDLQFIEWATFPKNNLIKEYLNKKVAFGNKHTELLQQDVSVSEKITEILKEAINSKLDTCAYFTEVNKLFALKENIFYFIYSQMINELNFLQVYKNNKEIQDYEILDITDIKEDLTDYLTNLDDHINDLNDYIEDFKSDDEEKFYNIQPSDCLNLEKITSNLELYYEKMQCIIKNIEGYDPQQFILETEDEKENDLISSQNNHASEVEYNHNTKSLIVNYHFPNFEDIQKLPKEVTYISSKNEFKTTYCSDTVIRKMYDSLIYQIIFSIAYAIFSGDRKQYVESVIINGFLDTIDRSIGKKVIIYIASLHINRKEFEELDLQQIDPKQCFKRLKGVAGIQMDAKIPVAPIMQTNKDDKRFVEAYDVAKNIDVGTNLAAMDWQDFENLIRELFEWKFSSNGGECKITQASRDGGVDAIAFDPDPILGGKIIIQAKRYTNVVGVSAVRDLYGTLINEGASKGILITTSDYGSDAHKFAKGKPITLLNGNNLLHLLNEMGTKAYINIKEAKKILKEEKK